MKPEQHYTALHRLAKTTTLRAQAKYQDRLFEFRGQKKPLIKPPPPAVDPVSMTSANGDASGGGGGGGLGERAASLNQGMTEYIGFVNIVLLRGKNLVSPGFGQVRKD